MISPAASQTSSSSRRSLSLTNMHGKKKSLSENGGPDSARKSMTSQLSFKLIGGVLTVKQLRLSKALTIPANTSVYEACHRMAARRLDALLLTDSNALLCGILTDKDIALRVIAQELNLEQTPVSKVMTKKPVFVHSETLAVEALQKMVQGKFRHLPVVQNGEVIALLDIAKCLCDAIARMDKVAEKGKVITSAVENLEKRWGTSFSGPNSFIDTLREQMFKPTLSTTLPMNPKILKISPTDTILTVTKKMHESQASCGVVITDDKPRGIFTSKDILMRVITQDLPPDSTIVEKVMTPNPECINIDTPIVDALHLMHDGKFLHLPIIDKDGNVVAVVDVIQIIHAVITTLNQIGSTSPANNEATSSLMQKFWDSTMALSSNDDDADSKSENSSKLAYEGAETSRFVPYLSGMPNLFSFKMKDKKGRLHRFICDNRSLTDLTTAIIQRVGDDVDRNKLLQIMYEDEDRDKIMLASDIDLAAAVEHAREAGWKSLRLHLDYSGKHNRHRGCGSRGLQDNVDGWSATDSAVAAGAAIVVGLGILTYLRRTNFYY